MPYKALYIDDHEGQQKAFSGLLSLNKLDFSTIIPATGLSEVKTQILDYKPEILVLDYRLDEGATDADYRAGSLAQLLREAYVDDPMNDHPIALLSTEANIRSLFKPDQTSHDLFDLWFLKSDITDGGDCRRDEIISKLEALVEGYHSIKTAIGKDVENLIENLLGITPDEFSVVPAKGFRSSLLAPDKTPNRPHVIAQLLLRTLIERTGLLLSENEVYARLGIAPSDAPILSIIDPDGEHKLQYSGVFSGGWNLVWKHRLESFIIKLFEKPSASLTGLERGTILSEKYNHKFSPAVSRWTEASTEYFAFACCVCQGPTELRNSVAAHDIYIPSYCERHRICFDCLDEEERMEHLGVRVDEGDLDVLNDIRTGEISRPE